MADESIIWAECPNCQGGRRSDVLGKKTVTFTEPFWESTSHFLLECRGCGTIFYGKWHQDEDMVRMYYEEFGEDEPAPYQKSYFPDLPKYPLPDWLSFDIFLHEDQLLTKAVEQTYEAFNKRSYVLAAIGCRVIFDRLILSFGIKEKLPFKEKVARLTQTGIYNDFDKEVIQLMIEAGNAAAHRGWSPTQRQMRKTIEIIEVLLRRGLAKLPNDKSWAASIPARGS